MSERIKELAEQARDFAVRTVDVNCEGSLDEALDSVFEQKFAELIVEECIKSIESTHKKINHTEWELGAEWGHKNAVNLVKKHFEVK